MEIKHYLAIPPLVLLGLPNMVLGRIIIRIEQRNGWDSKEDIDYDSLDHYICVLLEWLKAPSLAAALWWDKRFVQQ